MRSFIGYSQHFTACPIILCRRFFTPKIVGTFYMQGYKVKEKTAIVPPVSKLSGHPDFNSRCVYIKYVIGWENLLKAVVMNEVYSN